MVIFLLLNKFKLKLNFFKKRKRNVNEKGKICRLNLFALGGARHLEQNRLVERNKFIDFGNFTWYKTPSGITIIR
jgi:hypothetical protein